MAFVIAFVALCLTTLNTKAQAPMCDCPKFTIQSNREVVKAGDIAEVRIDSGDPEIAKRKFTWTVSPGTIISGQGTTQIRVQTTEQMLTNASPTPQPSPTPFFRSKGRPTVALNVHAALTSRPACSCSEVTARIWIGSYTEVRNGFANVTDLKLSKTTVLVPCEPGTRPQAGQPVPDGMIIDVAATAFDPENDVLSYEYNVTGGVIRGRGSRVQWDLTGVVPGTYSITAGADDGCGVCGRTKTQTVTVSLCTPGCSFTECPSIEISGPERVTGGDLETFTANVSGGTQDSITYDWTVVNGDITNGKGSPSITVKVPHGLGPNKVSVTVKIGGLDPRGNCLDSVTREFP